MIEKTGEGKSAVATPDGKKPKEEEEEVHRRIVGAVLAIVNTSQG